MKIIVCIKQVPSAAKVPIDPRSGALVREGCPSDINQDDKHSLEEALLLKAKHGGSVTAVTMGPPQAEESLRESLAMGVDKAILLSDRSFAGADTSATSYVLAGAVRKLRDFDLIFCGKQTSDGDTAQVGPQLAEELQLPQVTYVRKLQIKGKTLKAERSLSDGYEVVEAKLPVLVTVTKEINTPRKPTIGDILDACRQGEVTVWNAADLNLDKNKIGLEGSLTKMTRAFVPQPRKRSGKIYKGSAQDAVQNLVKELEVKHLI
ncbi:MAG: electron transfer flavoprotein subunit beta/FixA family protein [Dehalococcoidia bacterium]|nr:electron transfer flavoprotein subunit beta/FixA family protein [Dehalococcoidia bacterium]